MKRNVCPFCGSTFESSLDECDYCGEHVNLLDDVFTEVDSYDETKM